VEGDMVDVVIGEDTVDDHTLEEEEVQGMRLLTLWHPNSQPLQAARQNQH